MGGKRKNPNCKCGKSPCYSNGYCNECNREYQRKWRAKNREKHNKDLRDWRTKNRERWLIIASQANKKFRENNKEKVNEYSRNWRINNPEKAKAQQTRHHEKHREKRNACSAIYREQNREKMSLLTQKWQKFNPEKVQKIKQRRRAKKINAEYDGWTRLEILKRDFYKCAYCCFVGESKDLHVDHIIPLSRGGSSLRENVITSCISCNDSKGSKLLSEWKI